MSSPDDAPNPNVVLPTDVVLQILARLPVKSLLRCRSVCRLWSSLPSDPHFVLLHLSLSSPPSLCVALEPPASDPSSLPTSQFVAVDPLRGSSAFSLDFLADRVRLRASSHGLLLCASARSRGLYYVCNPMTRASRALPRPRERPFTRCQPEYEATLAGLAVDPSPWRLTVVLAGFRRSFGHWPRDQLVCMVFDAGSNSWTRSVSSLFDEFTYMNRNQAVYANRSMNWLTHSCSYLLAFNLQDEAWGKVALPGEVLQGRQGSRIYLLELEGSVSVVQMSGAWMSTWVLKDHLLEQWALVDRVHLRCIDGYAASAFPISQTRDAMFMATQKKILMYNRKSRVWKEVYGVKGSTTYPLWFSAFAFQSTLLPCHHRVGA